MAKHNEIGALGEKIACEHLIKCGLEVLERNTRYPYGEIDIVAREIVRGRHVYHFVEVKSVAREKRDTTYHPLQNISREKLARQRRAIQTYIMSKKDIQEWQYDVICVYAPQGPACSVEYLPSQIL